MLLLQHIQVHLLVFLVLRDQVVVAELDQEVQEVEPVESHVVLLTQ